MEQPRDDVRGLARGGRGAPRLVGDVYGIGDWCGAQASARGRPVGPPSQNLPLTTFQDRRALLSPVPEWVPADTVGGERFWEILASSGQVGQIGHFSGGFWDEPFPQPRLGEAGFRFLVDSPLDRSAAGAPYLSAADECGSQGVLRLLDGLTEDRA